MIFVVLGTFPIAFSRPLLEIESLLESGEIDEKVIVQRGYTPMESKYMDLRDFIPYDEMNVLYKEARIIISHAGVGSIIKGMELHKKVIAIARLSKYGECVDDHQMEILDEFSRLNYVVPWREQDSLREILVSIQTFYPNTYISNNKRIINYLTNYIESL